MAVSELEALVGPGGAHVVDLGGVAGLEDLRHPVHALPLVLPDADADEAAGDDLAEVGEVDPLLQLVPGQPRTLQVILVLDGLRSVSGGRGPGPGS